MTSKIKTGSKSPLLAAVIDESPTKKKRTVAKAQTKTQTSTAVVKATGKKATAKTLEIKSATSSVAIRLAHTQTSNKKGVINSLTLYVKTGKGAMIIPISASDFGDLVCGLEREFEAEVVRK
jgi:hypothetical protein